MGGRCNWIGGGGRSCILGSKEEVQCSSASFSSGSSIFRAGHNVSGTSYSSLPRQPGKLSVLLSSSSTGRFSISTLDDDFDSFFFRIIRMAIAGQISVDNETMVVMAAITNVYLASIRGVSLGFATYIRSPTYPRLVTSCTNNLDESASICSFDDRLHGFLNKNGHLVVTYGISPS